MPGFRSGYSCSFSLFLVSGLLISALTGCSGGGGSTTPPPKTLTSISVTPGTPSVAAGLTEQFKATGGYSDGSSSDLTSSVTWSSATAGVATINGSGLATSKIQGSATITATSGTVSGSTTLTVTAATLVSITVTPVTVQLGATTQMQATGTYTDQSTQDLTGTATWSASNGYVANVSSTGLVTSVGAGSTPVTAAVSGQTVTSAATVLASPRYLYVAADAGRTISRLAVDGNSGQPRFTGYSGGVSGNIGFPWFTVDPSGTHAYLSTQVQAASGSGQAGTVAVFSIDPSRGALTQAPGSPFSLSFALGCLKFAPSGQFAYAISGNEEAGNELAIFSVNADASLALQNTIPYPYYPSGMAVDPIGQYLYVATTDVPAGTAATSSIYGYSIDGTTGALTALNGSPWSLPAGTYGQLAFHPTGSYLYAADLNDTNVYEYTVDRGTGALTNTATVASTCINPSALQFLPDGSHAYSLCGESGGQSVTNAPIVEFSVGSNGQLTFQGTAFAGPAPMQMQVDEAGKFLYILGTGSDTENAGSNSYEIAGNVVLGYQVQPDGSLKLGEQIAGHVLENAMVLMSGATPVTWTTTSAYVTTAGDNKVTPYSVNSDGTLIPGTSLTTAAGPFSASTLPWGSDLLFATQGGTSNLDGYAVSGASIGSGTSLGLGTTPGAIVMDPSGKTGFVSDPADGLVDAIGGSSGYWGAETTGPPGNDLYTFNAEAGAGPIAMDPSGRYIVTANQTAKSLSLIEPLGAAPTPATTLTFTPLTVTFDATGNLIFVAGDDGQLHMFSSNGLGTLTDESDVALLGTNTASVAVNPTSSFVYAAGPAGLNAFAIHAGKLTPVALNLGVSLENATGVFMEPAGKYLYVPVSNGSTNALYLFTMNADGTLTASSGNPVATPNHATSMVFQATVQ